MPNARVDMSNKYLSGKMRFPFSNIRRFIVLMKHLCLSKIDVPSVLKKS